MIRRQRAQVILDFGEVHDIGVFVRHVVHIDLVREFGLIERAFLDNIDVEACGIAINHAGAHAA